MFSSIIRKVFRNAFGPRAVAAPPRRRRRPFDGPEALEPRYYPDGTWQWVGPPSFRGGNGLWSNSTATN
jgi:hypothetical protein